MPNWLFNMDDICFGYAHMDVPAAPRWIICTCN